MVNLRLFQAVYGLADDWWWWGGEEGIALGRIRDLGDLCTKDEAHNSNFNDSGLCACVNQFLMSSNSLVQPECVERESLTLLCGR